MTRAIAFLVAALFLALPAQAADKFVFGTNWKAEAEHGGSTRRWRRAVTPSTGSTSRSARAGRR